METTTWLTIAQRLQALAQTGLEYSKQSPFDLERYAEIRALSVQMVAGLTEEPLEKVTAFFTSETGYQTPKVDVRVVIFRGIDEVLMVQEKIDQNRWTLPGGWADVGLTPFEVAEKEAEEETGLHVRAVRLLALFDKKKHQHPPQPWYVYKCFVLCEVVGGELGNENVETTGARWMREAELESLDLSTDRVTKLQLATMFEFARQPEKPTLCD